MKLHDLRPAAGSHTARTRVGRGIAAGKGKTAGRGTKGQKARAGGSIPPWFEGGQTPLHMRIPKLRGFKNRAKIEYEIVNVGDISARVEQGAFTEAGTAPKKGEQLTINAETLRAVGLVRDIRKPLKVLGGGELANALFVVADAFTKSAVSKIEGAGGTVSVLEIPVRPVPALGLDDQSAPSGKAAKSTPVDEAGASTTAAAPREKAPKAKAKAERPVAQAESSDDAGRVAAVAAADGVPDDDAPDDVAESTDEAVATDEAVVADAADTPTESVDARDAVDADDATEEPLPGDDSETSSVVPGDDA